MKKIAYLLLLSVLFTSGCHTLSKREEVVYNYSQANYLQAYKGASHLADNGDPVALYATGYMLYYGMGIATDKDKARKYIRQAANRGYPPAVAALKMIVEDHPNMRVEPLGRQTPITYAGKVDASMLLHDVKWLRERNPTHYTIELQSRVLSNQIMTDLASKNNMDLAQFKALAHNESQTGWVVGDFADATKAQQTLAMLDPQLAESAVIEKFKQVQEKMLPE